VRRVIGGIGRVFITLGLLILLFVAYQLWGTGLYTSREQDRLSDQFNAELLREHRQGAPSATSGPSATNGATTTTLPGTPPSSTTTSTTEPSAPPPPPQGDAVARIRIPKIGVDSIVVEGVGVPDLRKGPGHYPQTPLPGQKGNAAIAGHRTTYGAPFGNLDQLSPGDLIQIRTLQGSFRYRMTEQLIVKPTDVSVLDPVPVNPDKPAKGFKAMLTLTTCNPKYSAAQRLVVHAELAPNQVALPAPDLGNAKLTDAGLSGQSDSKWPTVIAGLIALLVGLWWWWLFHRHPRWTSWVIGAIPFAIALFVFYALLERVLPANY
jgi:sortase A